MTSFQTGVLESRESTSLGVFPTPEQMALFRARSVMNTLTVLGPWRTPQDGTPLGRSVLAEPRGPDSNQVRVIMPSTRELRRRRKTIRRMNRLHHRNAELPSPSESALAQCRLD